MIPHKAVCKAGPRQSPHLQRELVLRKPVDLWYDLRAVTGEISS